MNLLRGFSNLIDDWQRAVHGNKPGGVDRFAVGRDDQR
jgi:hypothetical protein